ncbi:heterokaryon incompatibility protein-domain-containing protein [Rhypophila decipiens]|uniref:Heterokaryon incompatibility protein-domain-containing protein n=1 Tax=Rhypophila decipiens TaxID=261697 RepID=A0AAN7BA19_9PEZI|nr:heterokaryon incompatibility protein-domain-containing protein [Rhypophila decipiens]
MELHPQPSPSGAVSLLPLDISRLRPTTSLKLTSSHLYDALPLPSDRPDAIRVLHLDPDQTPSAQLSGLLDVVCLDKSPEFTALSYVWGKDPPSEQHTIRCRTVSHGEMTEVDIPITSSCLQALQALRNIYGRKRRVTIWVDAICINQKSHVEKGRQVPLMDRIYSRPSRVYLAWNRQRGKGRQCDPMDKSGGQHPTDYPWDSLDDWTKHDSIDQEREANGSSGYASSAHGISVVPF